LIAVKNIRSVTKANMILNDYQPTIEVDPETYEVRAAAGPLGSQTASDWLIAARCCGLCP